MHHHGRTTIPNSATSSDIQLLDHLLRHSTTRSPLTSISHTLLSPNHLPATTDGQPIPAPTTTDAPPSSRLSHCFCKFAGQELAAANKEMASNTEGGKSFARRDQLLGIEARIQKLWEENEVFKADSLETLPKPGEKFFGNFPFPYMNGYLHLGHAFSLSKLEFAAGYHRLRGANVLLPFAFHGTGMPIKASADKLCHEIERFGNPPVFSTIANEDIPDPEPQSEEVDTGNEVAPDKFKGKKSKATAKAGGDKYQWEIMISTMCHLLTRYSFTSRN